MARYTKRELAKISGYSKHTLGVLIGKGIVPRPKGVHPRYYYDEDHVEALRQHTENKGNRPAGALTINDLCRMFGISRYTIYGMQKKGAIPSPYGGRRYAYYTQDHVEAIKEYRRRVEQYLDVDYVRSDTKRKSFSLKKRAAVWDKSGGVCFYCGKTLHPFTDFHVDHVFPYSLGGSNELENLVGACASCNMAKSNKVLEDSFPYSVDEIRNGVQESQSSSYFGS